MRNTIPVLTISTLLLSSAAVAQGDQTSRHDAEAKGKAESQATLSLGSVRTMGSATAFAKVDADGDKVITQNEADAMKGLPQQFGKLDANGDGELTMQEFAALSVDSSGNRGPSAKVAAEAETGIGVDTGSDLDRPDDKRRGTRARTEVEGEATVDLEVEDITRANAVQAFNNVDADGNFKLDQQEAARIKGLERQFAELDRDGDGALDYAEFNAITSVQHRNR
jgi:Ca2+-binding EF-hand superfamily protein